MRAEALECEGAGTRMWGESLECGIWGGDPRMWADTLECGGGETLDLTSAPDPVDLLEMHPAACNRPLVPHAGGRMIVLNPDSFKLLLVVAPTSTYVRFFQGCLLITHHVFFN